jgi:hypothetical protein
MSEKKKRGLRQHLAKVLDDLHKGLNPPDYGRGDAEVIPHSTVNELLQLLEASKVAYLEKEDNKWHYTWYKEKKEVLAQHQEFTNLDEYHAKLDHSKALIEEIGSRKIQDIRDDFVFLEEFTCNRIWPMFLQHLKERYPKIYENYEEWKKQKDLLYETSVPFNDAIKRFFKEQGFTIEHVLKKGELRTEITSDSSSVSPIIIDLIKQILYIREDHDLKEIKMVLSKDGIVDPFNHNLITTNVDLKSKLEAIILRCITDSELKSIFSEIERIRWEVKKLETYLSLDISKLIDYIKVGSPLKGSCDACKYTIGR